MIFEDKILLGLLVPGKRAQMIKLPPFKDPINIVTLIAGYDI